MQSYTLAQLLEIVRRTIGCKFGGTSMVLEAILTQSVLPSGARLRIFKHPANNCKSSLEVNDMVQGYASETKFVTAIFTGGDPDNWDNFNILNEINNIQIQ